MDEEWKEVSAIWQGDNGFIGENLTGGRVQMGIVDGKPGVSPMEMLLLGVAGCTGVDVSSMLIKKRQKLTNFQVQVFGKRAEVYPRVYTQIRIVYHLWGNNIDPKAVEHSIKLSKEKYCSASIMLGSVAKIETEYKLHSQET